MKVRHSAKLSKLFIALVTTVPRFDQEISPDDNQARADSLTEAGPGLIIIRVAQIPGGSERPQQHASGGAVAADNFQGQAQHFIFARRNVLQRQSFNHANAGIQQRMVGIGLAHR